MIVQELTEEETGSAPGIWQGVYTERIALVTACWIQQRHHTSGLSVLFVVEILIVLPPIVNAVEVAAHASVEWATRLVLTVKLVQVSRFFCNNQ